MKTAIQKAIKGGYKDHAYCNEFDMYECFTSYCHATVLLDPDFWKALGKAEGWKQRTVKEMTPVGISTYQLEIWQDKWHNFIDHLISGKDVDSFFNNLLTN